MKPKHCHIIEMLEHYYLNAIFVKCVCKKRDIRCLPTMEDNVFKSHASQSSESIPPAPCIISSFEGSNAKRYLMITRDGGFYREALESAAGDECGCNRPVSICPRSSLLRAVFLSSKRSNWPGRLDALRSHVLVHWSAIPIVA